MISLVKLSLGFYGSRALFIDLHGFGAQPSFGTFDLILGTANRGTVATDADVRFAQSMRAKGYTIFLPREKTCIDDVPDPYDAGFTTRNVFLKTGVDAIQLEVSAEIRMHETR